MIYHVGFYISCPLQDAFRLDSEGEIGVPISRLDALAIARATLERAERGRLQDAEAEAGIGMAWPD